MKNLFYLALAFLALIIYSCSNETDPVDPVSYYDGIYTPGGVTKELTGNINEKSFPTSCSVKFAAQDLKSATIILNNIDTTNPLIEFKDIPLTTEDDGRITFVFSTQIEGVTVSGKGTVIASYTKSTLNLEISIK